MELFIQTSPLIFSLKDLLIYSVKNPKLILDDFLVVVTKSEVRSQKSEDIGLTDFNYNRKYFSIYLATNEN